MSKSLGNLVMVSDLLERFSPDTLRLYLGSHHYREAWSYAEKDLQEFQALADTLSRAAQAESGQNNPLSPDGYADEFSQSMENDLGTPGAVRALQGLAHAILEAATARRDVQAAQQMLRKYCQVLGLSLASDAPEPRVVKGWNSKKS